MITVVLTMAYAALERLLHHLACVFQDWSKWQVDAGSQMFQRCIAPITGRTLEAARFA